MRDRGDIVVSWLTKIVIVLGLLGIVGFDALSIGVTTVSLTDQSQAAAREASEIWKTSKDIQLSYDTAVRVALDANSLNEIDPASFKVDQDGTVHLQVRRVATTLVVHRIGLIEDWADVSREASARYDL